MTTSELKYYKLPLKEIIREANDIFTYKFKNPNLNWEEGANIHLGFEDYQSHDKKKYVRHFSIMNLDHEDYMAFTTRLSDSPFKKRMSQLKLGDEMIVFKFSNRMPMRYENRPIVLLSMGIGIAAMKPIMETYQKNDSQIFSMTNITVSREKIYEEHLASLTSTVHYHAQNRMDFNIYLEETYNKNNIYYIVGSDCFLEDTIRWLKMKGHSTLDIEVDKKADKKIELFK